MPRKDKPKGGRFVDGLYGATFEHTAATMKPELWTELELQLRCAFNNEYRWMVEEAVDRLAWALHSPLLHEVQEQLHDVAKGAAPTCSKKLHPGVERALKWERIPKPLRSAPANDADCALQLISRIAKRHRAGKGRPPLDPLLDFLIQRIARLLRFSGIEPKAYHSNSQKLIGGSVIWFLEVLFDRHPLFARFNPSERNAIMKRAQRLHEQGNFGGQ